MALGKAQHLAAQRGQAAVEGVEIVDQKFDLGRVELDAFDFGGELFRKRFVFLFLGAGKNLALGHQVDALLLELFELAEEVGDTREAFDGIRLERGFHLSKGHGVVLFLFVVALGRTFLALLAVFFRILVFIVVANGRTGGFLGNLAVVVFILARFHLLGRGFLRQHGIEIEDLAQLHFLGIERFGPLDDGVEGNRALTQAHDHHVAAGFDALGDRDFAFAAEQFDRAHFAQVHADRVIGAFAGGELARGGGLVGCGLGVFLGTRCDFLDFGIFLGRSFGFLVAFDDLHTHVGQG